MSGRPREARDRGAVLLLVLVVGVVLSTVVIVLVQYTSASIRYGQVSEARADRLAAADGAMRDAIERVRLGRSLCTTSLGSSGVMEYRYPADLNEAVVDVSCRRLGTSLSEIAGWAIVVTGEAGVPAGEGLVSASGAGRAKLLGGPMFVADLSLVGLGAPVELRDGDLWYTASDCPSVSDFTDVAVDNLEFLPVGVRGTMCTDRSWSDIYPEPSVPDLSALPLRDPVGTEVDGCTVFEPGVYTSAPEFGPNAYFRSGDYRFVDVTLEIKQTVVTAGRPGAGGALQEIDNVPCDDARDADPAPAGLGATFFLDGSSSIVSQAQGAIEIMPRLQGNSYVSVQALATSDVVFPGDIVGTLSGNQKEVVLHGLVWAPRARLTLGEVTNTTAAQLTGGAVVAAIDFGTSASSLGFVIQVEGSPASSELLFEATATSRGTTTVEAVVDARFTNPQNGAGAGTWEVAVESWRVRGATG
ncbi:MAG: hypothetical protein ACO3D0_00665 [Ilumatobacteraceae bacterium]